MDKNRKENTETRTKEEKERAFVFLYVCDCVWQILREKDSKIYIYILRERHIYRETEDLRKEFEMIEQKTNKKRC